MILKFTKREIDLSIEAMANWDTTELGQTVLSKLRQAQAEWEESMDDENSNIALSLAALDERIERLEREKEERDREQFNRDAERAWRGE